MVKATKLILAAALVAGSCSLAIAQGAGGGGGGEPPKGSDANPPSAVKQQPGETKTAPANKQGGSAAAPMATKDTGMSKNPASAGSETGTAKDPAGPGAERKAPGSGVK